MKRFITGVLLVALSCAPSLAQAEVTRTPQAGASEVQGNSLAQGAPIDDAPGSALDYAAREAAAPRLGGFEGGSGGIYIGTGALVVALVVLLILVIR